MSQHTKTVVISEPEGGGHPMDYAEAVMDAALQIPGVGRVILLTTREGAEHPNCRRVLDRFDGKLELHVTSDGVAGNRLLSRFFPYSERQRIWARQLSAGLDAIGPGCVDLVLVPHFESVGLVQVALRPWLFRGRPWATVAVGIRFHHHRNGLDERYTWQDLVKEAFFRLVIRSPALACFGSVDPTLADTVRNPKVAWCPEPVEMPVTAEDAAVRRAYGIRPDTCVILVFGYVDRRKNIDLLLRAVSGLDPELDVTVVIVGRQSREVATLLAGDLATGLRDAGRLLDFNEFILFSEHNYPLSLSDITWVVYEKRFVFVSSVLSRSAMMGRPVLGRAHGLIGRFISQSRCGLTIASDEPGEVSAVMARLVRDPALRRSLGENGRRAFSSHTPEAFARPLLQSLATAP